MKRPSTDQRFPDAQDDPAQRDERDGARDRASHASERFAVPSDYQEEGEEEGGAGPGG